MSDIWDATIYSEFLDARTKPARDLLAAIPLSFSPATCHDLGCGPGNSTALLKERFPNAQIFGIDSSRDMLKKAQAEYPDIYFSEQDIGIFEPTEKIDCIFANASLHWVANHDVLLPKLAKMLTDTDILAIQMPNNFHSTAHQTALHILQSNETWKDLSNKLCYGVLTNPMYDASHYHDLLAHNKFSAILCWETTYFQEMNDHIAIFNWIKGAGLRPALVQMNKQHLNQFEKIYVEMLQEKYPTQTNGKILFPFRRLFLIGIK